MSVRFPLTEVHPQFSAATCERILGFLKSSACKTQLVRKRPFGGDRALAATIEKDCIDVGCNT